MKFTVFPDAGWRPARWVDTPRGELLRELNVTARHGDSPPVMLQLVFERPGDPVFVAADAEAGSAAAEGTAALEADAVAPSPGPAPEQAAPPTIEPEAPQPVAAAQAASPAPSAVAMPTASAPTRADAAPPPRMPGSPAARDEDGSAAVPIDPAPGLGASAPPPPADSVLALVWKPGVIERVEARPAQERDYTVIATDQLSGQRGQRVRLLTLGGKLVDGELRGVEAGQARVRVRVAGGTADVDVPLANIREARLVLGSRR